MRHYYTADQIREAEAPLLASLPDGALMRRAAHGLANAIARELVLLTGASRAAGCARSSVPATTVVTHCGRRRSCAVAVSPPPR